MRLQVPAALLLLSLLVIRQTAQQSLLTKSINILCVSVFTFVAVNILCSFFCTRYMSPSFGVNTIRISRHVCILSSSRRYAIPLHPSCFSCDSHSCNVSQNIFSQQQRARSLRPPEPPIPELRRKGKEDPTNTGRRAEETIS